MGVLQKKKMVVAGNWKMNKTRKEAKTLIDDIKALVELKNGCEVVLCVPFTNLDLAVNLTQGTNIKIGAQNCHFKPSGAFTGEVSAKMLSEMGVSHVVLGHSERRQFFAETDETVNLRLKAALSEGLCAIVCVGESLAAREDGITFELIAMQVKQALKGVSAEEMKNVILAYEPIWAIGTGKTASSDQAQEVCCFIRKIVEQMFDVEVASGLVVQYGGSVNEKNCAELFSKSDICGGLIGGASLDAKKFAQIVDAACNVVV